MLTHCQIISTEISNIDRLQCWRKKTLSKSYAPNKKRQGVRNKTFIVKFINFDNDQVYLFQFIPNVGTLGVQVKIKLKMLWIQTRERIVFRSFKLAYFVYFLRACVFAHFECVLSGTDPVQSLKNSQIHRRKDSPVRKCKYIW